MLQVYLIFIDIGVEQFLVAAVNYSGTITSSKDMVHSIALESLEGDGLAAQAHLLPLTHLPCRPNIKLIKPHIVHAASAYMVETKMYVDAGLCWESVLLAPSLLYVSSSTSMYVPAGLTCHMSAPWHASAGRQLPALNSLLHKQVWCPVGPCMHGVW